MKDKLLKVLEFDSLLSSKGYSYFPLSRGGYVFIIESTRNDERIEERFSDEEFEMVKKIFDLK